MITLTREQIRKIVEYAVVDRLKVDPKEVTIDAHFVNDLGADSLGTVDLLIGIEDGFEKALEQKFVISDQDAEGKMTVRAIMDYVEARLCAEAESEQSTQPA